MQTTYRIELDVRKRIQLLPEHHFLPTMRLRGLLSRIFSGPDHLGFARWQKACLDRSGQLIDEVVDLGEGREPRSTGRHVKNLRQLPVVTRSVSGPSRSAT